LTPYEIVVEKVLPYIKALVAIELHKQGLSQNYISKLMGVSQAMVNKYISRPQEYYLAKLKLLDLDADELLEIIKILTVTLKRGDIKESIMVLNSLINKLLVEGRLCKLHMKYYPQLSKPCSICKVTSQRYNIDPHILSVKEAVKLLESDPHAYLLVPEVGLNIVECVHNAKSIGDVVGIPGRIVKVMRRVKAVADPSYGASRHLATILLAANSINKSIRACMNIRYDENFIEVLNRRKWSLLFSGPHKEPKNIEHEITKLLLQTGKVPNAIIDRGGLGLEPMIYLFSSDAISAVKEALSIVKEATRILI